MFSKHEFKDSNKLDSSILTFGNFDGVHLGHQKIFDKILEISKKESLMSIVMTFTPHTNAIINPNKSHMILTSLNDKINIINKIGIDVLCTIEFNKQFSERSPSQFIKNIISKYNPKYLVLGYDNKFGKNGIGDADYIKKNKLFSNIKILKVDPFIYKNDIVKTTLIKYHITNKDIGYANILMNRQYSISGKVIKGSNIGKSIGFPTANIQINEIKQIIPKDGVYSVNLIFDSVKYDGICNIGFTPTLNLQDKIKIEVHVIDCNIELYDKNVKIEFKNFIRNEIKFQNKSDLINQIKIDIDSIRKEGELKC